MRNLVRAGCALAASASAGPTVTHEVVSTGSLRQRLAERDDADLVLLVVAEHEGALGDCGCDGRPMGSVARAATYRDAVQDRTEASVVLIHAGGWARPPSWAPPTPGAPRSPAQEAAHHALESRAVSTWDVLDPTFDVIGQSPADCAALGSRVHLDPRWLARSTVVIEAGGRRVALAFTSGPPGPFECGAFRSPTWPVEQAHDVDGVVVIGHHLGAARRDVAAAPGVLALVDADHHTGRWAPEDLDGTPFVRLTDRGAVLTELRFDLDADPVALTVRDVDLDDRIRPRPDVAQRVAALEAVSP
jgi:hypothetical protein